MCWCDVTKPDADAALQAALRGRAVSVVSAVAVLHTMGRDQVSGATARGGCAHAAGAGGGFRAPRLCVAAGRRPLRWLVRRFVWLCLALLDLANTAPFVGPGSTAAGPWADVKTPKGDAERYLHNRDSLCALLVAAGFQARCFLWFWCLLLPTTGLFIHLFRRFFSPTLLTGTQDVSVTARGLEGTEAEQRMAAVRIQLLFFGRKPPQ